MTKTEIKEKAQEEIMYTIQMVFNRITENNDMNEYTEEEMEKIKEAASKQMARIEKMFGYEENSWMRGC